MKVAVPGATGLIGRMLVRELVGRGHEPVVLTRDPGRVTGALAGFEKRRWIPDGDPSPEAFVGVDAVVNLAGAPIASGRWTKERKRMIRDSRVLGTAGIVRSISMLDSAPEVFVAGSALGYYGSRGNDLLGEDQGHGQDFLAGVCRDLEKEAVKAESFGVRVVRMRTGVVLSSRGGALEKMLPPFRIGLGGRIGSGRQWFSWIHEKDIVEAIIFFLENRAINGAVNAVSPHAVTNAEFTRTLGNALNRPAVFPVPPLVLRVIFGEMAGVLTFSIRASADKLVSSGYSFQYDDLREALDECLASRER
jgi:uncharacterized protein (TIGR01777 family)